MKQNTRKNKTDQSIVWPTTSYFTIEELHLLNPTFINITLRVRLTNAINDGLIVEIGCLPGGTGRPPKVFSMVPVTQIILNKARQNKINLVDNAYKMVNVVSIIEPRIISDPSGLKINVSPLGHPQSHID